jgi:hypothetical protein
LDSYDLKDIIISGVSMNQISRRISALIAVILISFPLSARTDHVRIRTMAGMEPVGMLSITGMNGGGETSWSSAYGFTPGLEIYYILNRRIDIGAGFKWQLDRRVFRDSGNSNETFAFIPLYITARIHLTEMEKFSTYALVKLGYAFFLNSQEFREIWISDGGTLDSTIGGIYASGALGVLLNLSEHSDWGLDLSMDAGYAFHSASGNNSHRTYPISYQIMTVDISLDWRF